MLPTRSPFTPLHPTHKACSCGYIGTKSSFYKHIDSELTRFKERANREPQDSFFSSHGEVPLNVDDPRVTSVLTFKTPQQIIDTM